MLPAVRDGLKLLGTASRTPEFWHSVTRHAIPVLGVWALGWSSVSVAVFFLLESWLFLTARLTIEVTFDPHYARGDTPRNTFDAVRKVAWMFMIAAPVVALLLFAFGGFLVMAAFPAEDWREFWTADLRSVSFQISFALLAIDVAIDTIQLQRRLLTRSPAEKRADDRRVRIMFYRVVALLVGMMVLGVASDAGFGGLLLVLMISVILVWFDTFPRRALRMFDRQFHGDRSP